MLVERALVFGAALEEADTTLVVAVPVYGLDEAAAAVRALIRLLLAVRLLVHEHVAQLGRPDGALRALEHLVGAASLLAEHVVFGEAHVLGCVGAEVAALSFLFANRGRRDDAHLGFLIYIAMSASAII